MRCCQKLKRRDFTISFLGNRPGSRSSCDRICRRRVIQGSDTLTLVDVRRNAFLANELEAHPHMRDFSVAAAQADRIDDADTDTGPNALFTDTLETDEAYFDHSTLFDEVDSGQTRMQQEAMRSSIVANSGQDTILNQTDPVLDSMAKSLTPSGEENNMGEWDPNIEELESPCTALRRLHVNCVLHKISFFYETGMSP